MTNHLVCDSAIAALSKNEPISESLLNEISESVKWLEWLRIFQGQYESGFKLTGTYIINQLVITKQDVNPIKNINESW